MGGHLGTTQQPGQIHCGCDVIGQAEHRPPDGHTRIGYDMSVEEVKDPMRRQSSNHQPEIESKAEDWDEKEPGHDDSLHDQRLHGLTHDCKEAVIGRDHNQNGGIKGTIAVKADEAGQKGHG